MLKILRSSLANYNVINNLASIMKISPCYSSYSAVFTSNYSVSTNHFNGYVKHTNFISNFNVQRNMFIYRSGDMLWEGVTGPPGRVKKRARGKRRVLRNKIDLNYGRKIGENKMQYKWPGLNAPILDGRKRMTVVQGEKDEAYEAKLTSLRLKMNKKKRISMFPPLKRGWSGSRLGGQSLGPPVEVLGQKWEGYDSRVLEMKMVSSMTRTKGRLSRYSVVIMVGNSNGLAGVGRSKTVAMRNSLKQAKYKATQRLEYFELRENRTIWHPDFIHDWSTNLYIRPMPEGYGLVCHRLIKTMCQLIGIKDLYAKVEGSVSNNQVIVRAFTALLRKQETYQKLANRLRLNVVEVRSEYDNYPRLLAAPEDGVTRTPDPEENLEFNRLHVDGKVFRTKKYKPFYLSLGGPMHYARVRYRFRNQDTVHRLRQVYEHLITEGHLIKEKIEGGNNGVVAELTDGSDGAAAI